jgi:hypothetical protein
MLEQISCAYCGDTNTEWDYLRPLVEGQRPKGNISEIHNLVPACGKGNQNEGNKNWLTWMRSTARLSSTSRGIVDIEERIVRPQEYEGAACPRRSISKRSLAAPLWECHLEHHNRRLELMREAYAKQRTVTD